MDAPTTGRTLTHCQEHRLNNGRSRNGGRSQRLGDHQ